MPPVPVDGTGGITHNSCGAYLQIKRNSGKFANGLIANSPAHDTLRNFYTKNLTNIMKKTLLAAALLAGAVWGANAGQTTYDYSAGLNNTKTFGTEKAETYDMAISLTNPALVGMKVTSISVPLRPATDDQILDLKFFMTKELTVKLIDGKNINVPDIAEYDLTYPTQADPGVETATVTYTLSEPFVIPEGGIYVGYELRVKKADKAVPATMFPVITSSPGREGGFWLRSSRSQRTWADISATQNLVLQLSVGLEGNVSDNALGVSSVTHYNAVLNEEGNTTVEVVNTGLNPVKGFDYKVTIGNKSATYKMDLSAEPIPAVFGAVRTMEFEMPAYDKVGTQPLAIEITAVNGAENFSSVKNYTGNVSVLPFIPVMNPFVEEYTGTGCQWCPRGYAAMEHMKETYPEFIGVAWHGYSSTDPMYPGWGRAEGVESWPIKLVSGFPYATINRVQGMDPYYGLEGDRFGLDAAWQLYRSQFTTAQITAWAQWDADNSDLINVSSKSEFVADAQPGETFRVEYILVADGLTGPEGDTSWYQTSAFSNTAANMEYMEMFAGKGNKVAGLTFNDVGVLSTGPGGIKGSVPEAKYNKPVYGKAVLNTLRAVDYNGKLIPFSKDKLRVVALLLKDNGLYGEVVNCARVDILPAEAGIETINGSEAKSIISAEYFDLTGRRVANPQSGTPVIRINHFNDGSTLADKVIF